MTIQDYQIRKKKHYNIKQLKKIQATIKVS